MFQDMTLLQTITGLAILTLFPLCVAYATFSDFLAMKISNRISLALVGGFVVLAPLVGMGWEQMAWHAALAVVVLLVGFGLFSLGVMGGGDAKLMSSVALWLGFALTVPYIFYASVLGALVTMVILVLRRASLPPQVSTWPGMDLMLDRTKGVPYGLALGPMGLFFFSASPWVTAAMTGEWTG